jgi:hypothetical protein
MNIGEYKLVQTCGGCPEQYDVFLGEEQVGYLRLRHGNFTAEAPDCGGTYVYEAHPRGDGIFEENERLKYLTEAVVAIHNHRSAEVS